MNDAAQNTKPILAITMGDPRGIGPEVIVKALAKDEVQGICSPVVVGDSTVLRRAADLMATKWRGIEIEDLSSFRPDAGAIPIVPISRLPLKGKGRILPGQGARASFAYIERAGKWALDGLVEGIVTAPVSKEAISRAGIPFQGHTEYLARVSGAKEFVMMLAGPQLRVCLVTTHVALKRVSASLTEEKILSVIKMTGRALREYFGFDSPRIAVAALNPHAGEGGLFGKEEIMISRATRRAKRGGIDVSGPWPADSLFHRAVEGEFEAVVCMYHDQGLIPLKLLHFETGVNVTLGLPFIRTSVDHGVAFDIAGRGVASSRSMEEAIRLAASMALQRRKKGRKEGFRESHPF